MYTAAIAKTCVLIFFLFGIPACFKDFQAATFSMFWEKHTILSLVNLSSE